MLIIKYSLDNLKNDLITYNPNWNTLYTSFSNWNTDYTNIDLIDNEITLTINVWIRGTIYPLSGIITLSTPTSLGDFATSFQIDTKKVIQPPINTPIE